MNIKTTIALSALVLASVPAMLSQAFASTEDFPGDNGQGHTERNECDHGPEGAEECPGGSGDPDGQDRECTTVFAGNSDHEKASDCPDE